MDKIKITIDRFEEDKAVLVLEDGQKIIINKEILGHEAREGDSLYLNFEQIQDNNNSAKNLLADIINNSS